MRTGHDSQLYLPELEESNSFLLSPEKEPQLKILNASKVKQAVKSENKENVLETSTEKIQIK